MTRLAEIEAHIGGMSELRDIIGAMRSLAGMRVQEALRALPGIRRYVETVASALAGGLLLLRQADSPRHMPRARLGLILCTAEHGFVGGFTERLVEAGQAALETGDLLFILGSRGNAAAIERGLHASFAHPMATRCAAAPETIRHLSSELYRHIAQGQIGRVEVIHARYRHGSASTIEHRLLLPLDLASLKAKQPHQPPLHNLDPIALHEKLIAEYTFALLTEAAVESIASENAARFAVMESAHDNISKKLDKLRQAEREARQSEITAELLDLVSGADAQARK